MSEPAPQLGLFDEVVATLGEVQRDHGDEHAAQIARAILRVSTAFLMDRIGPRIEQPVIRHAVHDLETSIAAQNAGSRSLH